MTLVDGGGGSIALTSAQPEFQANGTDITLQSKLNLVAGSNITIADQGSGAVKISAVAGASNVVATIANQNLTGNTGNTLAYTSPSGGFYRLTASISITKVGTAGTIGLQLAKNPTLSLGIGTGGPMTTLTLGNSIYMVCCVRLAASDKLYWNSQWSSVTGSPTASMDLIIEYLGA